MEAGVFKLPNWSTSCKEKMQGLVKMSFIIQVSLFQNYSNPLVMAPEHHFFGVTIFFFVILPLFPIYVPYNIAATSCIIYIYLNQL